MTEAATRFITPVTMQALSGQPVWTDLWDARVPRQHGAHRALARPRSRSSWRRHRPTSWPSWPTAWPTTCSRRCASRARCPLLVAPGDERRDVAEPGDAAQRRAAARGRRRASPARPPATRPAARSASAACSSPPTSRPRSRRCSVRKAPRRQARARHRRADRGADRSGARSSPTSSSGKMGYAVARAAQRGGREVTLVSGPVALATPPGVARIDVRTAAADVRSGEEGGIGDATSSFRSPRWPTTRCKNPSRAARSRKRTARR